MYRSLTKRRRCEPRLAPGERRCEPRLIMYRNVDIGWNVMSLNLPLDRAGTQHHSNVMSPGTPAGKWSKLLGGGGRRGGGVCALFARISREHYRDRRRGRFKGRIDRPKGRIARGRISEGRLEGRFKGRIEGLAQGRVEGGRGESGLTTSSLC